MKIVNFGELFDLTVLYYDFPYRIYHKVDIFVFRHKKQKQVNRDAGGKLQNRAEDTVDCKGNRINRGEHYRRVEQISQIFPYIFQHVYFFTDIAKLNYNNGDFRNDGCYRGTDRVEHRDKNKVQYKVRDGSADNRNGESGLSFRRQ